MTDVDESPTETDVSNSRRSFLQRTTGIAASAIAGLSLAGNATAVDYCPTDEIETVDEAEVEEPDESTADEPTEDESESEIEVPTETGRSSFSIATGTDYETPVFVTEGAQSGPTAVVVGGVHGSERGGIEAASEISQWEVARGRLVVIPEANAVAAASSTYTSPAGDLNRQFPTGREPTTAHARAIWDVITEYDADVVFDLHTSGGIYGSGGPSGVGQAIFPTAAGRSVARSASSTVNGAHFESSWGPSYAYSIGNTMSGARPRLIHKVGGDLGIPGFLIEATRYGTDLDTRTEWLTANVAAVLEETGFEF